MPIDLTTGQTIEKNKLTTTIVELVLVEFNYLDEDSVRVCLNNTQIIWDSDIYYPADFKLSDFKETKDSTTPKITLSFRDLGFVIIPIIEQYDGADGAEVIMRVVDSNDLTNTTPKLEETMELLNVVVGDNANVTLNLGVENLSTMRMPPGRYLKNNCRYDFKQADVAFIGGTTLEPAEGYHLTGVTSGAVAKIIWVEFDSGDWATGDVAGTFTIKHISGGEFTSGETVSCYKESTLTTLVTANVAVFTGQPAGRCNYTGSETTCDRSYARCVVLGNQRRSGAFIGISPTGIIR